MFAVAILHCKVLKNLELIPAAVKKENLKQALEFWAEFALLTMLIVPLLAKERRVVINGVSYILQFPPTMSDRDVAAYVYKSIPSAIAGLVSKFCWKRKT
ncbi:MAG: hypothetical protein HC883_03895 [Bdellovibrionaceae bacterium]|nr:hypothetical protein [Pseudobdellovibrionaceae bacterium]